MLSRKATWKECYQALKQNHYPTYSLWFLATFAWLTDTHIHAETQEECDEYHRQLEKHLEGVEQRFYDYLRTKL